MRGTARQLESLKEGSARESEEIMGALQGQVDASNKVGGGAQKVRNAACVSTCESAKVLAYVRARVNAAARIDRGPVLCCRIPSLCARAWVVVRQARSWVSEAMIFAVMGVFISRGGPDATFV